LQRGVVDDHRDVLLAVVVAVVVVDVGDLALAVVLAVGEEVEVAGEEREGEAAAELDAGQRDQCLINEPLALSTSTSLSGSWPANRKARPSPVPVTSAVP
jgi:hypothetical protein